MEGVITRSLHSLGGEEPQSPFHPPFLPAIDGGYLIGSVFSSLLECMYCLLACCCHRSSGLFLFVVILLILARQMKSRRWQRWRKGDGWI